MSGGGTRTQTVTETSNNEPWAGAQPALNTALGAAIGEFNQGPDAYYPGDTVADLSGFTLSGANSIANNAGNSQTLAGGGLTTLFDTMNPGQTAGRGNIEGAANGNQSNPWLTAIGQGGNRSTNTSGLDLFANGGGTNPLIGQITQAGGASSSGPASSFLASMMNGEAGQNPQLDAMFKQGAGQMETSMREAFARSGRGANNVNFADSFGRSLGDMATQLYGNAYENDMARRMQAGGALFGAEQNGLDRNLSGLTTAAGLTDSGLGRQLTASGALSDYSAGDLDRFLTSAGLGADVQGQDWNRAIDAFLGLSSSDNQGRSLGLTAAGMLPSMFDFSNAGARDMMGLGELFQAQDQAETNGDIDRYNYESNADRQLIEWLNAIATGQGQLGGSSVGTSQQPVQRGSPLAGVGSALSGVAGLASIFGLSDPRTKKDVVYLGDDARGVGWYEFGFHGDAPDAPREVGVMADELERIAPQFVAEDAATGFKVVDYDGLARWRVAA